jgi:predicted GNAT family N-acyltransferase
MSDMAVETAIHSKLPVYGPDGAFFVRPVLDDEIADGVALAAQHLAQAMVPAELLRRVRNHNPDSIWGIFKPEVRPGEAPVMIGFCSFLILNTKGAAALLRRSFDFKNIDFDLLAPSPETAEIIYIWGILARNISASIVLLINDVMVKTYRGRPQYATAATEAGLKFMLRSGYVPVFPDSAGLGALHRRVGPRNLTPPAPPRRRALTVVPVATADEFEKAMTIRQVYLAEQGCPFAEEFDGNDRTGTVFLGYVDGEPAATLRVRYFADFFKMERLAVLPRFRRTRIAWVIVQEAVDFCRRKGYRRGLGHAQKHLERFWEKFGFKRTARNIALTFSDYQYIEMYGDLEPHDRALTMETEPYIMIRPEGRWDEPGVLELSANRPAVNAE